MENASFSPLLPWIYKTFPNLSSTQITPFLCACHHGDLESVKKLIELNTNVLQDEWNGRNGAYFAWKHKAVVHYLGTTHSLYAEGNKLFLGGEKMIFFGSSNSGKSTLFKQLRTLYGIGYEDK
eukprot:14414_1